MSSEPREQINFRATPALRKRIEDLASERKTTVAGAIKSAVLQATKQGGVPDEQEILELLGEAARTGSVSAMKELRAYHREQRIPEDSDDDFISQLEEFANQGS